jgi:molybdopterin converting factor small subunit
MAVTILIPEALRAFTEGQSETRAEGADAGEAIASFITAYPDICQHLYDDNGNLRSFISLYVGDANIKDLNGLDTLISSSDAVMLVPAIAGGV